MRAGSGRRPALDGRTAVIRLFDAYAGLLTERQRGLLQMYYHDDLSLGEIAAHVGVTRQAVFDSLRRSAAEMRHLEGHIGVAAEQDRTARSRKERSGRLEEVEREAARLKGRTAADVAPLMRALRALRQSL
jgi:uncharacterized protein